jgi:hypothetical protein
MAFSLVWKTKYREKAKSKKNLIVKTFLKVSIVAKNN